MGKEVEKGGRGKGLFGLIVCWIVFSLLLGSANSVAKKMLDDGNCTEASFSEYRSQALTVAYYDELIVKEDLAESVRIAGWVFSDGQTLEDNKEVCLLLKSAKQCYKVAVSLSTRGDVLDYYANAQYDIVRTDSGFTAEFATLTIEDGDYDIYAYCYENENAYGLSFLRCRLFKNGRSTELEYAPYPMEEGKFSKRVNLNQDIVKDGRSIKSCIDVCEASADYFEISGWCFAEDMDCTQQSVYISLEGVGDFRAGQMTRGEVGAGFCNKLYTMSGFSGRVPVSDIPQGITKGQLLLQNKEGTFWVADFSVLKDSNVITTEL